MLTKRRRRSSGGREDDDEHDGPQQPTHPPPTRGRELRAALASSFGLVVMMPDGLFCLLLSKLLRFSRARLHFFRSKGSFSRF